MSPSSVQAARVLIKYRTLRLYNFLTTGMGRKKKQVREANARKPMTGWIMGSFLGVTILFSTSMMSLTAYNTISSSLGHIEITEEANQYPAWGCGYRKNYNRKGIASTCEKIAAEPPYLLPSKVIHGLIIQLCLVFLTMLLMNIGSKELAAPEWDLEWLATLPVPTSTLIGIRILERTVVNPFILATIWPFLTIISWHVGAGFWSVLVGLGATAVLSFISAILKTFADTGLRLFLSQSRLRNIQAVISVSSSIGLIVAISVKERSFLFDLALSYPLWLNWTPVSLVVRLLITDQPGQFFALLSVLALEALVLYLLIYGILYRLLRDGIAKGGAREGTLRTSSAVAAAAPVKVRKNFFSPIQRKELMLLARDRTFMVQTLVVPALFFAYRFFLVDEPSSSGKGQAFSTIGATAFGAAVYSLLFSVFQVVNAEGQALWLLYSFPRKLEDILKQKVILWTSISLTYPLIIFSVVIYKQGVPSLSSLATIFVVLFGVVIYSVIAACLAVFASDPYAEDARHRTKPSFTYLYFLLAGFYAFAIVAEDPWQQLVLIILSLLMTLALLQKSRDHIPYLLDPSAAPPPRVSLSDGLIGAMCFFVVQGATTFFYILAKHPLGLKEVTISFILGGFVTFCSIRLLYWKNKTQNIPAYFGEKSIAAALWAVPLGLIASTVGAIYLWVVANYNLFPEIQETVQKKGDANTLLWILMIAVVAAPIFEEFIFRGLIFSGIRRSWGTVSAVLGSAAIFAMVHPISSVVPVFFLGIFTAIGYRKSGLLLTPLLIHAIYNFTVVGIGYLDLFGK
jgi:hypothetical protein